MRLLTAFDIKTAAELGWDTLHNGKLMDAAENDGFEVLLTGDKTIPGENAIAARKIGIVMMSANHWPLVRDHAPAVVEALHKRKPGQALPVYCGEFHRGKAPKPEA